MPDFSSIGLAIHGKRDARRGCTRLRSADRKWRGDGAIARQRTVERAYRIGARAQIR
jgi:hypothetical protein